MNTRKKKRTITQPEEWIDLAVSKVYWEADQEILLRSELSGVIKTARSVGPARTVECGQDENLGGFIAKDRLLSGKILVKTMLEPSHVAVVG